MKVKTSCPNPPPPPSGILFPLIVPVVVALTDDETVYIKTVAAALGSSVFGNLCSPIADTTIAGILFTGKTKHLSTGKVSKVLPQAFNLTNIKSFFLKFPFFLRLHLNVFGVF